jgi:hypothetical protein
MGVVTRARAKKEASVPPDDILGARKTISADILEDKKVIAALIKAKEKKIRVGTAIADKKGVKGKAKAVVQVERVEEPSSIKPEDMQVDPPADYDLRANEARPVQEKVVKAKQSRKRPVPAAKKLKVEQLPTIVESMQVDSSEDPQLLPSESRAVEQISGARKAKKSAVPKKVDKGKRKAVDVPAVDVPEVPEGAGITPADSQKDALRPHKRLRIHPDVGPPGSEDKVKEIERRRLEVRVSSA